MWINRGILRKVSRSNRGRIPFSLTLLVLLAVRLEAEQSAALLVKGPLLQKGIDALGVNAIPCLTGTYEYTTGTIGVTFTRYDIPISNTWQKSVCRHMVLYGIPHDESSTFLFKHVSGWSVLFSFPLGTPLSCAFAETFIQRFSYFLGFAKGDNEVSFPAVLRIAD